ncbi:MAG: sulfurase [Pseudomonadota bacterium]
MPALVPTDHTARIVYLGRVEDRAAGLVSTPLETVHLTFEGVEGEAHGGLTRPSCSRVAALYPKGTEIRNTRQLSVMSAEELADIARAMGVASLPPHLLGASMVIEGIPEFSRVPPSSRLQAEDGATIAVDMENRPCHLPADPIDAEGPGNGQAFREAARGRRGVTAWVEREGVLHVGGRLRLFVPDQPAWSHIDGVRTGR